MIRDNDPLVHYHQWVDTSAGGLLLYEGVIHPVVNAVS